MYTVVARVADLTHGRFCTGFLIGARGTPSSDVRRRRGLRLADRAGRRPLLRHAGAQAHEEHSWTLGGALQMTDMRQTPTTVTDDSVPTRQQGHMPQSSASAPHPLRAVQGRRRPRVHRPGGGGQVRPEVGAPAPRAHRPGAVSPGHHSRSRVASGCGRRPLTSQRERVASSEPDAGHDVWGDLEPGLDALGPGPAAGSGVVDGGGPSPPTRPSRTGAR